MIIHQSNLLFVTTEDKKSVSLMGLKVNHFCLVENVQNIGLLHSFVQLKLSTVFISHVPPLNSMGEKSNGFKTCR